MAKVSKNYRQLKDELDQIVADLDSVDLDVEEALKLYDKGQVVIKELEEYLKTAENRVEELKAKLK